jgi:hypothetical protein
MNDLEKDLYIALLENLVSDLENELFKYDLIKRLNDSLPRANPNPWREGTCKECGIRMDGVMGFVCPNTKCPTGMGRIFID